MNRKDYCLSLYGDLIDHSSVPEGGDYLAHVEQQLAALKEQHSQISQQMQQAVAEAEQARQQEADTPDMAAARQIVEQQDDYLLPFEDDDGNAIQVSARQLLADMDSETSFINTIEQGALAAITCFLRHGDL